MYTFDAQKFLKFAQTVTQGLCVTILLCVTSAAHSQSVWKGDMISLKGTSIPSACWPGQIRKNTSSDKLMLCNSGGSFVEIIGQNIDAITFQQQVSTPSTPASLFNRLYFKSDGLLYKLSAAGTETLLDSKAPTASPTFTGTVTTPGLAITSNNTYDIGTVASALRRLYTKSTRLNTSTSEANFADRIAYSLSGVTAYATSATLTPSGTASSFTRGVIRATICGSTGGVGNGCTITQWYFDISNGAPTVAVIGSDVTSGTGAPLFRLTVSGSDILIQVQSSNGSGSFGGVLVLEVIAPRPEGSPRTYTLT